MGTANDAAHREPWNKDRIVGQKAPFKLEDIWALRVRLQMEGQVRELAVFNLGIDSKLRRRHSVEPPTWHMADDAVAAECDGILSPSQARHGGTNLVVYRSSGRPASQLHVYDPADMLKKIAMPRQMD